MGSFIFTLIFVEASIFAGVSGLVVASIFKKLMQRQASPARVMPRNRFRPRRHGVSCSAAL